MQNDIVNELGKNFIEYAVAVNTDRAIPDAKSGLKPVAKRILWGASAITGCPSKKPHVKSARLVGDVMGRLHPHGDSSIYGALIRLSQNWVLRYPLIEFHGNNGNIIGDDAAHMRYTECRLAPLAEDGMLAGIDENNVDFIDNYDETEKEPVTLPAIFPNLLCNPNTGIGVAMACSWASHNLKEVAKAIIDYINGEEPTLPGPDFPTGGVIINAKDIPNIMATGRGSVKIRGKYTIEKNNIIFTEIPYGVYIENLLDEINEICDKEEIKGITSVKDNTNKKGIKIIISCDKTTSTETVVRQLFQKTSLQTSFSYNQVALVGKTPTELNLKDCIKIYIDHNSDCIKREAEFNIEKHGKRLEVVNGLLKALADIDEIIKMIKASESSAEAKTQLINRWEFTEVQAKAILAMRLSSLTKLDGIELNKEKENLESLIKKYMSWRDEEQTRYKIIIQRLTNIVNKYGDERRTQLLNIEEPKEDKEVAEVVPEDVVVVITKNGLIKRIPKASFKTQRRNGKGVKTVDEALLSVIKTNTIDNLLLFTDSGKMYKLLVDNIPVGTNASKGISIHTLTKIASSEKVIACTSVSLDCNKKYVIFVTKNGLIKKTLFDEYSKVKRGTGIAAINLKEGDTIANVSFIDDNEIIYIITHNGYCIGFNSKEVSATGRATAGVKSIKLGEDDYVAAGLVKEDKLLAIITENGKGKKINTSEITLQARAGKGSQISKEKIAGATFIEDTDNLLLVGKPNSICINATEIPLTAKTATGNVMIKNSIVTAIVKL